VIVPDLNLLVHAYNAESKDHSAARTWWEALLTGDTPVGLPWIVVLGFLRLVTQRRLLTNPYPADEACAIAESWLARPNVQLLHPGDRHAELLFGLMRALGTAGNLTTDAHLAALALEHGAELQSTDADFGRFAGLRWVNPLATTSAPHRTRRPPRSR
jgi:toxin-antitoxin system PIN domain toxin